MPQGIDVDHPRRSHRDRARPSVHDVQFTLVLTIALVIGRESISSSAPCAPPWIPGVAVPLALIGTFGVMKLLDFSLDNLSLMAAHDISNRVRPSDGREIRDDSRTSRAHIEAGRAAVPRRAQGARSPRSGFTIVSLTVSLRRGADSRSCS